MLLCRGGPFCKRSTLPGTQVYFYLPHPFEGRNTADSQRWHGPAVVLAAGGPRRYFGGLRNRTLLVAAEDFEVYPEAVAKTQGIGSESRDFLDVREENQPSKDEEPEERSQNAQPFLSKSEQDRSQALPRQVSPKPKLIKSLPGVQPARRRCS